MIKYIYTKFQVLERQLSDREESPFNAILKDSDDGVSQGSTNFPKI
jgi:hypothetical protein